MKSNLVSLLPCAVIALIVGWVAHAVFQSSNPTQLDLDQNQAPNRSEIKTSINSPNFATHLPVDAVSSLLKRIELMSSKQIVSEIQSIGELLRVEDNPENDYILHVLYKRLARISPTTALELVYTRDANERWKMVTAIFTGWAQKDFASANAYLHEPSNNLRLLDDRLLTKMINGMSVEVSTWPVDKITSWIKSLKEIDPSGKSLSQVAALIASKDINKAAKLVETNTGSSNQKAVGNVARAWAMTDPKKAIAWAQSLSENRSYALEQTFEGWAEFDPDAATQAIDNIVIDDEIRTRCISTIARSWAKHDPRLATSWAIRQNSRDGFMNSFAKWASTSPEDASKALTKQEPGLLKDRGIQVLADLIIVSDPQSALTWVLTASDPEFRFGLIRSNAREWWRRDSTAFLKWASSIDNFTTEEEQFLQQEFGFSR